MASSLSANDGWSWVVRGTQVLREHWTFWLAWMGLQLVIGFAAGLLIGMTTFLHPAPGDPVIRGIGGQVTWVTGAVVVISIVLGSVFYVVGWAKAFDHLGYRPFRWADVGRATWRSLVLMLLVGLVVAAVVLDAVSGDQRHLVMVAVIAVVLGLPVLMVIGFLMTFLMPFFLDSSAGCTSIPRAMDASARLVWRQWLAVLIADLLLMAGYLAVGIVGAVFRTLLPVVGGLVQDALQMVMTIMSILVFAVGYVHGRGLAPTSALNGPAAPSPEQEPPQA